MTRGPRPTRQDAQDEPSVLGNLPRTPPGRAQPAARRGGRARPRARRAAKREQRGRGRVPEATPRARSPPAARSGEREPAAEAPPASEDGGGIEELAGPASPRRPRRRRSGVRLADRARAARAMRGAVDRPSAGAARRSRRAPSRRAGSRAFWHRAYARTSPGCRRWSPTTCCSALFPFALLVLFVFGQMLQSPTSRRASARPPAALPGGRAGHAGARRSTGSARTRRRSGSSPRSARSGSGPRSGARWTPPSAASTTSSAAAGSRRSASRW